MGNLVRILFLLGLCWATGACTHDNEEELYGKPDLGGCDLSQVTYALTIRPLLQQHCYSCHASGSALGNVVLDDYSGVKKEIDNGRLLGAVRHLPGYTPMPLGRPKLSDCDIARIIKWHEAGATNN